MLSNIETRNVLRLREWRWVLLLELDYRVIPLGLISKIKTLTCRSQMAALRPVPMIMLLGPHAEDTEQKRCFVD